MWPAPFRLRSGPTMSGRNFLQHKGAAGRFFTLTGRLSGRGLVNDPDCDAGAMNIAGNTLFPAVVSGTDNAIGGPPCVARPLPLPLRVASIQAAIAAEKEPLVTLTHLLQLCRDEHRVLQKRMQDPGCQAGAALIVNGVRSMLPPR